MKEKIKNVISGLKKGFCASDVKKHDETSLAKLLAEHDDNRIVPFHMPGHKRADFDYLYGAQKIDITEIEGFDNLNDANGIILDSEKLAADVFCVKHARYLVNGSTGGVLAAIRSVCKEGDKILVARNCHKSVFNAVEVFGLNPVYVMPTYFEEYGFYGSVYPSSVKNAFEENPDIKLVVVTSPTYEGIISDIKSIAEICREHGAILFCRRGARRAFGALQKVSRKRKDAWRGHSCQQLAQNSSFSHANRIAVGVYGQGGHGNSGQKPCGFSDKLALVRADGVYGRLRAYARR